MVNTTEYNKQNYYTITVRVPKSKKELLQKLAHEERRSINQIAIYAIEKYYNIDLTTIEED